MIDEKFLKPYNPAESEDRIYTQWEESGFFNPDICIEKGVTQPDAETFSIALPPPNVTGVLHIGHAYEDSLQDTIIRFNRMCGKRTLWIPGTDSAAIATQARVEKNIQKEESKSRYDLGRDELVARVHAFAKDSENTILSQIRKMGASLDWSRYAYSLDETRNKAVMTAFVRMYEAGLIYRGHRIVNWDPKGQTTISDDEIVYEERKAILYTFKYSKDFPIPISTTRLETKVGDTAVAVHPDDPRYRQFVGKEYDLEFCGVPLHIKIIADTEVEMEFGTGALGVTPAHSHIDWAMAERHNLPKKQVINEYTKMMVGDERILNKKTTEAREVITQWLKTENLLIEEKEITQNISTAERTGGIVEPLPKLQWFVAVNKEFTIPYSKIPDISSGSTTTLKTIMRKSVESGRVQMPQEGFRKSYFHWIDNLYDWCISRQIWFGHRIPVWYKGEEIYCGLEKPQGQGWIQDEDVLDTWFSSSLWTFSTLGWPTFADMATAGTPGPENDLANYHPTSFMSPAYEILPLWVSRMIMMSGFQLGQVPFHKVMLHGLVRDKQGRKFSKSLANGIDPLDMIQKYGADALRMGLLSGTAIGNDINFDENKVKGYKHFANKLWNITRFVLENTQDFEFTKVPLQETDASLISELNILIAEITSDLENFRLHLAAEKLYHYIWHRFADTILEESKEALQTGTKLQKQSKQYVLLEILATSVQLLHPFMPFITEEIWGSLPKGITDTPLLMVSAWPNPN